MPAKKQKAMLEEIRSMNDVDLQNELERLNRHLFDLRAQAVTEKLENPRLIKQARKEIARIKTEQKNRELSRVES
jgi:large subunit ribosomal protein L29